MPRSSLLAPLAALSFCAAAHAQNPATIRATTTMHPDGSRTTTIVDAEKMTAEETVADARGKTLRKVTYLLDERNQPLGAIAYDAKGTILYRSSYKRDANGRIEEENVSSAEGEFLRKRVYMYGAQNKVTNMIEYDAQGRVIPRVAKAVPASPGRPDKKRR